MIETTIASISYPSIMTKHEVRAAKMFPWRWRRVEEWYSNVYVMNGVSHHAKMTPVRRISELQAANLSCFAKPSYRIRVVLKKRKEVE